MLVIRLGPHVNQTLLHRISVGRILLLILLVFLAQKAWSGGGLVPLWLGGDFFVVAKRKATGRSFQEKTKITWSDGRWTPFGFDFLPKMNPQDRTSKSKKEKKGAKSEINIYISLLEKEKKLKKKKTKNMQHSSWHLVHATFLVGQTTGQALQLLQLLPRKPTSQIQWEKLPKNTISKPKKSKESTFTAKIIKNTPSRQLYSCFPFFHLHGQLFQWSAACLGHFSRNYLKKKKTSTVRPVSFFHFYNLIQSPSPESTCFARASAFSFAIVAAFSAKALVSNILGAGLQALGTGGPVGRSVFGSKAKGRFFGLKEKGWKEGRKYKKMLLKRGELLASNLTLP